MAIGKLVAKFRILSGTIDGSLDKVSAILISCTLLHNFIMCEEVLCDINYGTDTEETAPNVTAPFDMSYLPVLPNDEFEV